MTKRASLFIVCVSVASVALAMGCSKKSSEAPATPEAATAPAATAPEAVKSEAALATPGAGGLTPQQIADALSKSVCKRKTTCNPGEGSESDCVAGLSKDMANNLSDASKTITQAQLDICLAAITKATCEQFASDKPPAGCEWIQ